MSVFVFDIETIPDIALGKNLFELHALSDEEALLALTTLRRTKAGTDFFPYYMQKIIAISAVFADETQQKVWSLGEEDASEEELITRFFSGIEKCIPTLVSWNGNGFDLPVLHYRALLHGIPAPTYWEVGAKKSDFRFQNYLNRYHYRHLDLMDILAMYQNKAFAPLDHIATMLGFPGKMGMSADKVLSFYQKGDIRSIRNYCETDVLNTYCIYVKFEMIRGSLSLSQYQTTLQTLKTYLFAQKEKLHLQEFANHMPSFPLSN